MGDEERAPHDAEHCCNACSLASAPPAAPRTSPGAPLVFALSPTGAPLGAAVVVREARGGGAVVVDVKAAEVVVGRVSTADVVLPRSTIGRRQSVLRFTADGVTVEDARSSCGTFVNGQRIQHAPVCAGDVITVGDYFLEVRRMS